MTSKERIDAVLARQTPDRPPFSFWYHFSQDEIHGPAAVQRHREQLDRYQMDFLKIMNDNPYPHGGRVQRVEELAGLPLLKGNEEGFGRQLELIAALKAAVGKRVYLPTTIFNAWAILRVLVEPPKVHLPPNLDPLADAPSRWIREAHARRPELIAGALKLIGENLARFAAKCLQAGADGIFLSVRDDWVDSVGEPRLYEHLVRPTDLAVLQAACKAKFNILHVCGKAVDFKAFAEYPAAVINWADRACGPSIRNAAEFVKPVLCGGVDNLGTLATGTPEAVGNEVRDAVSQAGGKPLIVAPGCTFDPNKVPAANLEAMARAVHSAGSR